MSGRLTVAERLSRRTIPRAVVAVSRVDTRAQLGATLRRRLGRRARVELYFSFDDPCSAVAVLDLARRLEGFEVRLLLAPVVRRGIADDPALALKRRYAVEDAQRLLRRSGLALRRCEPIRAHDVAFLAGWAAAAKPGPALTRFCVAALRHLWLVTDGSICAGDFVPLWRGAFGSEPPGWAGSAAVRDNERRMARRGAYDTPAAWVHGQWFFAHDRLAQIAGRLDDLGWAR